MGNFINKGTLQACSPCDCTTYGYRDCYNVTHSAIQKYLSYANTAGKNHNICPTVFLAFASVETDGNYAVSGGLVQVDKLC